MKTLFWKDMSLRGIGQDLVAPDLTKTNLAFENYYLSPGDGGDNS